MIPDADKLARYDDLVNLVEELHDENMRLRHAVNVLTDECDELKAVVQHEIDVAEAYMAEVGALAPDAARYRHITRPGRTRELRIPANESKASCDAAFDAEMKDYERYEHAANTMKRVEGPPLPVWHLGNGKDKARPERKYKR